jgi:molybdenum cofactor biosynthesis enzyme MoaA
MSTNKRSNYTFANINLLGKCNYNCYFCLGKDLESEFTKYCHAYDHFSEWNNLDLFLVKCKSHGIKQLYITGQNMDSLQYSYLDELIHFLKGEGFFVGLRTNGLLAHKKMSIINECTTCMGDAVSYTMLSLRNDSNKLITDKSILPYWSYIFEKTKVPFRIAIVVTKYNKNEIEEMLDYITQSIEVKYIQIRKICTENRHELLQEDMDAYDEVYNRLCKDSYRSYENANSILWNWKEVSFWKTVETTANSINYFTNGIISEEYFIIKGYLKEIKNIS